MTTTIKRWIGFGIVGIATLIAYACFDYRGPMPIPPLQPGQMGWIEDQEAVQQVAQGLRFKVFSDTPAGKVDAEDLPLQVFLWDAHRKTTGNLPPAKNQLNVGSCVSFGTNNAIHRTMCVQIMLHGLEEHKDICEEVTYAGSRVEIGGGRIRGDGSVGAWAAQFVQKWGVVSREVHGKHDLTKYDTARCRAWGQSGVPDDLEPIAREHPVKEITQVKSWAEAKKALAQGYGIAICSNQGFSMQRDSKGVAAASGSWAHCMCLDGYVVDGDEYGHIENSWGPDAHKGPVGWGNPSTAGFWAKASVIDRMLKQGDSWAFSGVKGFPKQQIDWFVRREPEKQNPFASLRLRRMPCDYSLAP